MSADTPRPERVTLTVSYPDQCCPGYCVEDLELHNVDAHTAERVVEKVAAREQALRERVEELEAALDRVRRLHQQDTRYLAPGDWCPGCGDREPCATKRAVRGETR